MVDAIGATLGTAGWVVGVLFLLTMALLPLAEVLEERGERRARSGAGRGR
jgi:hypothetical protein